ncbi:SDR family oxidoreductase [Streptosporangium sp. NPDC049644]|uniref:SDR family oxidoreductase n=1 Tax=Streptosporangium sp. NPDC049644 TaxID=3155507 RepID=UPI00343F48C3
MGASMTGRFSSKVIIVTGGTAGMGRAAAERIASEGGTVVLAARDKARGEEVAAGIVADGGTALFVPTDMTVEEEVAALVATTVDTFGRLDGAFNNAGGGDTISSVHTMETEFWKATIDLNLTSLYYSLRYEVPAILASGGGSIVNNASAGGVVGNPLMHAYVAAKHGVIGLTKSVALEMAKEGIRVNALVTGLIDTPLYRDAVAAEPSFEVYLKSLIPTGQVGAAQDVAAFAAFLLSDEAPFITGAALAIDGGMTAQ